MPLLLNKNSWVSIIRYVATTITVQPYIYFFVLLVLWVAADKLQGTELEGMGERIGERWACKWLQTNNDNGSGGNKTTFKKYALRLWPRFSLLVGLKFLSQLLMQLFCTHCDTPVYRFLIFDYILICCCNVACFTSKLASITCTQKELFITRRAWVDTAENHFYEDWFHLICPVSDTKVSSAFPAVSQSFLLLSVLGSEVIWCHCQIHQWLNRASLPTEMGRNAPNLSDSISQMYSVFLHIFKRKSKTVLILSMVC